MATRMFGKRGFPETASQACLTLATVVLLSLTMVLACSDSSTGPQPSLNQASILLNRLVVSVVPGGSEDVTIFATSADGAFDPCTITNSNPAVASVTLSDPTVHVTGLAYGITNITITSASGKSCTLPIQVYSPIVLEAGELLITYTDQLVELLPSLHYAVASDGFYPLGTYVFHPIIPGNVRAAMVVKAKPGSDAVAVTTNFEAKLPPPNNIAEFWPVPPPGYKALGLTWRIGTPDSIACIREDLTTAGSADYELLEGDHFTLWMIDAPQTGPHPGAYLAPRTFAMTAENSPPVADPVVNVLNIDLPMLAEAPYQNFVPKLTSYDTPADETVPIMAKAMLVPFTMVNDYLHSGDIGWQVANSPFYRLERQVYYKLQYHNHNQTSEVQTNNVTIKSGITSTETERIWDETKIELSAEVGLTFKAASGKVTATVSRSFGYETETSVAELNQREVSSSINTPPGRAAALWQKYNRFVLYRHNGTKLEQVTAWEFGIDSYVTDEYPD